MYKIQYKCSETYMYNVAVIYVQGHMQKNVKYMYASVADHNLDYNLHTHALLYIC